MSHYMVAVDLNFWLHIEAQDKRQANNITSTVTKIIEKLIEKEHGKAQGEMLMMRRSEPYLCEREEAWQTLEELDLTRPLPSDSDDSHSRYTIALHINDPDRKCSGQNNW